MLDQFKRNFYKKKEEPKKKNTVTIILPFFNEELILENTFKVLLAYIDSHTEFDFDLLCIDDGSTDNSKIIVMEYALNDSRISIVSHVKNLGLGQALQTGFNHSTGEHVIVLDADLSYSTEHITALVEKLITTKANVVVASPYMEGGRVSNIPWYRYKLSKWANRFLSFLSNSPIKTLTGMVRGYNGSFIRSLSLRSAGSEINPEIIYKAYILDKQIEEIPAHLAWLGDDTVKRSKLKFFRHTSNTILVGFLTKPFFFFIFPGLLVLIFAIYVSIWMLIHIYEQYVILADRTGMDLFTEAFKQAYYLHPHTFLMSFLFTMLAVQLISTGMTSLQVKYYFEELFSLGTKILKDREKK
jgi:glycosyltransferase involved in cell wall biosynthesis